MPVYEVKSPDGRTFEVTAPEGATQDQVLAYAQKNWKGPERVEPTAPTKPKTLMESGRDLLAGGVRGAGSIGATLLAPIDIAKDALDGKGLSLESNRQRRADMDSALRMLGADTDSTAFGVGKLGAEIAGTAGVGGAVAKPIQALAGTRAASGLEPLVDGVATALRTGGFRVGPLAGTSAAIPARVIGGAGAGAASAGLINPQDAGMGAVVGAAIPAGVAMAGRAGEKVGSALGRNAAPASKEMLDTARASMDAGYVIPPSMVKPTYTNRLIESVSGKYETAQLAATKNQQVTDDLVRKSLGLPADAPLSKDAMVAYRGTQYQAGYEPLKQFGTIQVTPKFNKALDDIGKQYTGKGTIPAVQRNDIIDLVESHKSAGFDSADAIDAIRVLRERADEFFTKGENALGKTYKAIAGAYEEAIEDGLKFSGRQDLLRAYRSARQNIAKSFTVEKGLREGAGVVDARVLGRELQKGKPLSGELKTAAQFGNVFNKAAQPPQLIGSPGVNALKPMASVLTGIAGASAIGPVGAALGAANYVASPVARSVMFSQPYQRGLLGGSASLLDEAAPLGLLTTGARAAPVLLAQ